MYRLSRQDQSVSASAAETSKAIDAIQAKMREYWMAGDAAAFTQFYTDDVRQIMQGEGIVYGKDEVVKRVTKEMGSVEHWESTSVDRVIDENVVSDLCQFTLKLKEGGVVIKGVAMITYVKQNGEWKIKYDMDMVM